LKIKCESNKNIMICKGAYKKPAQLSGGIGYHRVGIEYLRAGTGKLLAGIGCL
jgi:hypothetical protein